VLKRVLIANRGEIAVRVIRACHDLGIEAVAVHSEADRDSLHVKLADRAVCIGPAQATRSYLNVGSLIGAAMYVKADAIHPGYGFLAENANFSAKCAEAGIKFVGPTPESIRLMADKAVARDTAAKAGVPTVPGSDGKAVDANDLTAIAERIGYPVLIKAAAGGGGRGMMRATDPRELAQNALTAQAEAQAAFGDSSVYLEKYIGNARHVEVQVMGDGQGGVIHLGERDCSMQRRHQKIVEEGPSPVITRKLAKELHEAAASLSAKVNYEGAGTVEFLVDLDAKTFYFIEMNTRIQVEHPVTEMLTGVDLVREQLLVASGEGLSYRQKDIKLHGHAIECRINAEDASRNFMPGPGTLTAYVAPGGPGVRVDSHCYAGYTVPPYYDSMIAKVIVWGENRDHAIARMRTALSGYVLDGIPSTIPFHLALLDSPAFRKSKFNTRWLESNLETVFPAAGQAA
jgi:acetyl-CoA carboxylase biotin carboxylase subunit